MSGNVLLDISTRLLGSRLRLGRRSTPQTPDNSLPRPVEHAFWRGFAFPLAAYSSTSAQEVGYDRPVKSQ